MYRSICSLFTLAFLGLAPLAQADVDQDILVLKGLTQTLEDTPDDVKVRVKRGLYYLWRTYDYEKALQDFNRVLENDPDNVTAYIGRADVYTGWDSRFYNPTLAEADAKKALELAPEDSDVFRILGDLPGHPGMGKPEESLERYRRAIEIDPGNLLAQIGLAYTYAKKDTAFHSQRKAMTHAAKAMEIGPAESLAMEAMGDLLTSDEATRRDGIRLLNRAIKVNSRSMSAYLARGYAYLLWSMETEWASLMHALEEEDLTLLDSIRGNDEAFARALKTLGPKCRFARALRDFEQAQELCPHSDDVFSARAYALQNFPGQERQALNCYTRAAELNPHDAGARVERADFFISNPYLMIDPEDMPEDAADIDGATLAEMIAKRFPEVSRELETDLGKALKIQPQALAYFLRGTLRGSALEDYKGAISDLTAAIQLEPLEAKYYEARASVHEAFGYDQEAEQDRDRVTDLQELD